MGEGGGNICDTLNSNEFKLKINVVSHKQEETKCLEHKIQQAIEAWNTY